MSFIQIDVQVCDWKRCILYRMPNAKGGVAHGLRPVLECRDDGSQDAAERGLFKKHRKKPWKDPLLE